MKCYIYIYIYIYNKNLKNNTDNFATNNPLIKILCTRKLAFFALT